MKKYILVLVTLILSTQSIASSIYKCESPDGKVFFQGKPCSQDKITTMKKDRTPGLDISRLTLKEKFYLDTYVLHEQSKSALAICRNKNSKSTNDLAFRVRRYKEVAKTNIDAGYALVNAGTETVISTTFKNYISKKIRTSDSKLKALGARDTDLACGVVASKLSIATSQTPNRSSGYEEGDLDPEGND